MYIVHTYTYIYMDIHTCTYIYMNMYIHVHVYMQIERQTDGYINK